MSAVGVKFFVEVLVAKKLLPNCSSEGLKCQWSYNRQHVNWIQPEKNWIQLLESSVVKFNFEVADDGNDVERPKDLIIKIARFRGSKQSSSLAYIELPIIVNNIPKLSPLSGMRPTANWYPMKEERKHRLPTLLSVDCDSMGVTIWRRLEFPSSQDTQPVAESWRSLENTSSQHTEPLAKYWLSPLEYTSSKDTQPVAGSSAANNRHDLDEPIDTTNVLESTESEPENLLNKRVVARAAHLKEVTDLVSANLSRVVKAFEDSSHTECSIEDTSPLCGSQIVAQSLQRTQLMLASKQTLEKLVLRHNVIPRIDDALDNERELVKSVTKTARDAGEQQKELCDMEQNVYRENLALIERYNKEQMELLKTFQQEKERRLHLWAASRKDSLDRVKSIESKSQPLIAQLNTLVETTREYEKEVEVEVSRILGVEDGEEASKSSKHICQICFYEIGGLETSITRDDLKQRSCLVPCNHAMICLPCATTIWESTKLCPFCKVKLTTKPRPLYLD